MTITKPNRVQQSTATPPDPFPGTWRPTQSIAGRVLQYAWTCPQCHRTEFVLRSHTAQPGANKSENCPVNGGHRVKLLDERELLYIMDGIGENAYYVESTAREHSITVLQFRAYLHLVFISSEEHHHLFEHGYDDKSGRELVRLTLFGLAYLRSKGGQA